MAKAKSVSKQDKAREELGARALARPAPLTRGAGGAPPDPLSAMSLKSIATRVGIPVVIAWVIALLIPGWIAKAVVGVLTVVVVGIVLWALRFATKSRKVAQIIQGTPDTPEGRKAALETLDKDFKKDDAAAIFAKAQLQLQEDPRTALKTLEGINLAKVMAPIADEARTQRAMIHLMLGETEDARGLVDKVDMTRHKEPRTRATMAAVVGEAWARTGQPKKAVELLGTFDVDDELYKELKPQLLRARAFAYAWSSDTKQMRATLRRMSAINPQLLMGFITKKKNPMGVNPKGVHPALEKEAYEMVMRSGVVPRKVEFRR
ncbi:MAG: hypothetical protein WKG00_34845 [Polyangiaceae bacterium]